MKWKVYQHTNNENGKVYIGITSKDETERWKDGFGYRTQPVFFRGIVESGWNNFKHEVLFEGLTQKDALDIESSLIKKFASNNIKYGYNVRTISEHTIDPNNPIIANLGLESNFRNGLSDFFAKWLEVKIFDRNAFKKEFREVFPKTKNNNCRKTGVKSINYILVENEIPYALLQKRDRTNGADRWYWFLVNSSNP